MDEVQPGDVLVTDMTDPGLGAHHEARFRHRHQPGGRTCHAAIIARELGIPAVVGCGNATDHIQDGQLITVSPVRKGIPASSMTASSTLTWR